MMLEILESLSTADVAIAGGLLLTLITACGCMLWRSRHRAADAAKNIRFVRVPPEEDTVLTQIQTVYDDEAYAPANILPKTLSPKEKLQRALEGRQDQGQRDDDDDDDDDKDDSDHEIPTEDEIKERIAKMTQTNETTDSNDTA
jgi:hypothetical protein